MGKKRKLQTKGEGVKRSKLDKGSSQEAGASMDDSNMLVVLPKKKEKTESKKQEKKVKRLSKKERKRLNDIIQRKEKKDRRAELLKSLAKHQATEQELKLFTSITDVYSQTFKSDPSTDDVQEMKVSAIKGSKKKKKKQGPKPERTEEKAESSDTDNMTTDEEVEEIIEEEKAKKEENQESPAPEGVEDLKSPEAKVLTPDKSAPVIEKRVMSKAAVFVPVNRTTEVQDARLKLPILAEEQVIMETINENPVVIICGETGSGKTTQVPQFLYEAGYAVNKNMIGITEPRRVAAISMSKRVGMEMNMNDRDVSYQIRFEGNVTPDTKIKFLTDGVLLKEAQKDPLLTNYSVVIIDEAHERSVYTDILIGLLSIIVRQREKRGKPLKLIIMSATLRVEDFTGSGIFKYAVPPPVVKVDARQFPVTVHFNKKTADDYVTEAFKKVSKIHRSLPEGGVLVFVTGQQEVHTLVRKLRRMFPYVAGQATSKDSGKKESRRERKKKEQKDMQEKENKAITSLPKVDLSSYSVLPQDDEEAEREDDDLTDIHADEETGEVEVDSEDESSLRKRMGEDKPDSSIPLYVLPLYSLLASHKQAQVFEPPPEGCRICVVATNVAETSLTIPKIRYVVDSGKTKTKFYDKVTGVSTFRVTWVSKASADQRAGRAGRTGPGHCYRLYSSAVFNDFSQFSPPEITRRPVDDLVLQMKSMRIDKVANFPFPTPPDTEQIKAAESLLVSLGALRSVGNKSTGFKDIQNAKSPVISELGSTMAAFPVAPRYAKMLTLARSYKVLPYVVALVSALSVDEVFENSLQPSDLEGDKEKVRAKTEKLDIVRSKLVGNSLFLGDMMALLTVVGACEAEGCSRTFCGQLGVRFKAIKEIRKLRLQLTAAANAAFGDNSLVVDPKLTPPTDNQILALRKIVLGGLADHVARLNPDPPPGTDQTKAKRLKGSYQCTLLEDLAYVHPESVLYKNKDAHFVVYQSMVESSRLYMRGICCVEPHWFPEMAPLYCVLSKPLEDPPPYFDAAKGVVMCHRSGSFGRCNWEFPPVAMAFPDSVDCFRWFANFLLEGEVFAPLKKFRPLLVLSPSSMVKSWAKLQPKTESMLKALLNKGTNTKASLATVWKTDSNFLRREYLEWVKESEHADVMQEWPPLEDKT